MSKEGHGTVWLKKSTREKLHNMKRGKETIQTVVERLLACYEEKEISK